MTMTALSDELAQVRTKKKEFLAQIERIDRAGGKIVRLTAQGRREGENLARIVRRLRDEGFDTAVVADIHFLPEVAAIAAQYVDKVRINPGNYRTDRGELEELIARCRERGVALRIGVNHGSLAKRVFDQWGDTPQGMVVSAMEFLRVCKAHGFDQVVVSMKSSNTRVMVAAYRLLVAAMDAEDMHYPIHLGVTEAGSGIEGRIKSAVGIGALLCDGIGDTIRVSLTEAPEHEIPVAELLVRHFAERPGIFPVLHPERYSPTEYRRRTNIQVPVVHSEPLDGFRVIEAVSGNPTAELRAGVNGGGGIALSGTPVSTLPSAQNSILGSADEMPVSSGGSVDAAYILATPEQIAYIKPMIAMRNGSQSNVTLYASSRSAQGTAGPDFRLEMEGLQYSEIPMLAGSNPSLMQQALSAVRNDYSLARLYAMGADAWSLANHFTQMRQTPGFELNGNTGDLTANQDCVINRKLSWLKYQQGKIVPAS